MQCRHGQGRNPPQITWTCKEEATVELDVGCIHEHVRRIHCCPRHAAAARAGELSCVKCWLLGHKCQLTGKEVTWEASSDAKPRSG